MKKLLFFSLTLIIMTSCASSSKLLQDGRYDNAVKKSIRKINKNQTNSQEISVLRKAFKLANKSDEDAIKQLKLSGQPEIWESVYHHYRHLNQRQEMVSRLPDAILKKINFKSRDFIPDLTIAKRNAANYFDAKGKALLRSGNRFDARSAWECFQKEKQLFPETPDIDNLIYSAKQKGTTQILFKIKNNSQSILPRNFDKAINMSDFDKLNRKWLNFTDEKAEGQTFDYVITLNIQHIDVSPEMIDRKSRLVKKRIEDGWKYALDTRGNVKKDSAGNDIKIRKYKTIQCQVMDIHMAKSVRMSGLLEYLDNHNNKLMNTRPIASRFNFIYDYSIARGNTKALTQKTLDRIHRGPLPFPSNLQMISDTQQALVVLAAEYLREDIRSFN